MGVLPKSELLELASSTKINSGISIHSQRTSKWRERSQLFRKDLKYSMTNVCNNVLGDSKITLVSSGMYIQPAILTMLLPLFFWHLKTFFWVWNSFTERKVKLQIASRQAKAKPKEEKFHRSKCSEINKVYFNGTAAFPPLPKERLRVRACTLGSYFSPA